MDDHVEIFKALGDETRLRILRLLIVTEPLCCCEITDVLGKHAYNVSRHLKILHGSGLVEVRKEGRWAYYSLTKDNEFKRRLSEAIQAIPHERFGNDDENLEKRLALRVDGKCVIGADRRVKA